MFHRGIFEFYLLNQNILKISHFSGASEVDFCAGIFTLLESATYKTKCNFQFEFETFKVILSCTYKLETAFGKVELLALIFNTENKMGYICFILQQIYTDFKSLKYFNIKNAVKLDFCLVEQEPLWLWRILGNTFKDKSWNFCWIHTKHYCEKIFCNHLKLLIPSQLAPADIDSH